MSKDIYQLLDEAFHGWLTSTDVDLPIEEIFKGHRVEWKDQAAEAKLLQNAVDAKTAEIARKDEYKAREGSEERRPPPPTTSEKLELADLQAAIKHNNELSCSQCGSSVLIPRYLDIYVDQSTGDDLTRPTDTRKTQQSLRSAQVPEDDKSYHMDQYRSVMHLCDRCVAKTKKTAEHNHIANLLTNIGVSPETFTAWQRTQRGKPSGINAFLKFAGSTVKEDQYKSPTRRMIRKQSAFPSSFGPSRSFGGISECNLRKKIDECLNESTGYFVLHFDFDEQSGAEGFAKIMGNPRAAPYYFASPRSLSIGERHVTLIAWEKEHIEATKKLSAEHGGKLVNVFPHAGADVDVAMQYKNMSECKLDGDLLAHDNTTIISKNSEVEVVDTDPSLPDIKTNGKIVNVDKLKLDKVVSNKFKKELNNIFKVSNE